MLKNHRRLHEVSSSPKIGPVIGWLTTKILARISAVLRGPAASAFATGRGHHFLLRTVRVVHVQRATGIRIAPLRTLSSTLWGPILALITVFEADAYFDPSYAHGENSTSCCEQHAT
jgi:hypothetical protein